VALYGGHLLVRGGGATPEGTAFGGPIGYGHQLGNALPRIPGNAFDHHLDAANALFGALGPGERSRALIDGEPPNERVVQLQGAGGSFPGLAMRGLAREPHEKLLVLLDTVLSCYAERDQDAARRCLERSGGVAGLAVAFYSSRGFYDDGVASAELPEAERAARGTPWWHDFRVEGPGTVVHFRGWPHPTCVRKVSASRGFSPSCFPASPRCAVCSHSCVFTTRGARHAPTPTARWYRSKSRTPSVGTRRAWGRGAQH